MGASARLDGRIILSGGGGAASTTITESFDPQAGTWSRLADPPTGRTELDLVTTPLGLIFAVGGFSGSAAVSTVEIFNPTLGTWASAPSLRTARRENATAVALDGRIYAFGGSTGGRPSNAPLASSEKYDPSTGAWTFVANMPAARQLHAAATATDGRIFVVGGHDGVDYTARVDIYNPTLDQWSAGLPLAIRRGFVRAARAPDGRIYAVGGMNTSIANTIGPVEAYDPDQGAWTTVAPLLSPRGDVGLAVGSDGRLYALGGWSGVSITSTAEAYGPILSVVPDSVAAGSSVSLSGSNFGAVAVVRIYWDSGETPPVLVIRSDASGVLPGYFVVSIPENATSGSHAFIAVDDRSRYPVRRTIQVTR